MRLLIETLQNQVNVSYAYLPPMKTTYFAIVCAKMAAKDSI